MTAELDLMGFDISFFDGFSGHIVNAVGTKRFAGVADQFDSTVNLTVENDICCFIHIVIYR